MLRAELKRILKTRSTWCLAAIALLICLSSALSTVRQVVKYVDGGDMRQLMTQAARAKRRIFSAVAAGSPKEVNCPQIIYPSKPAGEHLTKKHFIF